MKLYKIGQPWQNELLIDNQIELIDNKTLVLLHLNKKLIALNPGLEKVVQFCLTFPSGTRKSLVKKANCSPSG